MNIIFNIRASSKSEWYATLLVAIAWSAFPLLYYFSISLEKVGLNSSLVITLIFLLLAIKAKRHLIKILNLKDLFFIIICILIFYGTYIIFPKNAEGLDVYSDAFLFTSLPFYLVGRCIRIDQMRDTMKLVSCISIAAMGVYVFFFNTYEQTTDSNSMFSSYMILPHTLIVLWYTYKYRKLVDIFFSCIGVLLILSFGARGPLLCLIIFSASLLIWFAPFKDKKIGRIIVSAIILGIYLFLDKILLFFQNLIGSFGLNTRIMDYFLNGEITDSSGRDGLAVLLIKALEDNPIIGYGVAGDYTIIGTYSHNILLEFLVSYGAIIGGLLILILFTCFYRSFKHAKVVYTREFLLLLISCGFINLLLSGTYLTNANFFMLIGYCRTCINQKNAIK